MSVNQFGMASPWTEAEDAFIRDHAFMDAEEIAAALGRGLAGLRSRASRHLRVRLGRFCEDGEARAAHVWSKAAEQLERHRELDPFGGCWLWSGTPHAGGYGKVTINGEVLTAHRVAWRVYRGAIPDGLHVLHRCDVRPCSWSHLSRVAS
jgi:hypothetical protein